MLSILNIAETLSLVLIIAVFLVFLGPFLKSRARRGLQLDLFIFALILFTAEVPHILITVGILALTKPLEITGLGLHTLSMGVLCVAITYRIYGRVKHPGGNEGGQLRENTD